jgi:hypothetical protein
MPRYVPQILIGVAVAFVAAFLFTFVFGPGLTATLYGAGVGAFTAYILANLAGNRKAPMAGAAERDAALDFQAPAGKALLYLYREGFVAMAAGLNVAVDGREVAQLKSPRFTRVVVAPGAHVLTAAFGGLAGAQSRKAVCDVTLAAGEVQAMKLAANMGLVQAPSSSSRRPTSRRCEPSSPACRWCWPTRRRFRRRRQVISTIGD